MSKKIERTNAIIQEELGKIIHRELEFPIGSLVTITRVDTSEDLGDSRIYISVIPNEGQKRVLEILRKVIYFLQKTLDKKLRMRPIPRIRFVAEKQTTEAARVEELLNKIKSEE